MRRFKKSKIISDLYERVDDLQKTWGFDRSSGTCQLVSDDVDRAVAYGEWHALMNLATAIHLGDIGV